MVLKRTALGKMVDMSVLATQNEKTRAIGNMGVNARGDIINSNNQVIRDRTSRIESQNNRNVGPNPFAATKVKTVEEELSKHELEFEQDDIELQEEVTKTKTKTNKDTKTQ